jgi:hypothetical protein
MKRWISFVAAIAIGAGARSAAADDLAVLCPGTRVRVRSSSWVTLPGRADDGKASGLSEGTFDVKVVSVDDTTLTL